MKRIQGKKVNKVANKKEQGKKETVRGKN